MIDYYNAFISYKHSTLDTKVAEDCQRQLERFHIPHAIRRKTGKHKIERIFRDKDELHITSNLSDTIENALNEAEYLIVICSPRTKESIWVDREIEFFLKSHDKSRVLTVLAEGEPEDIIPEVLQYEEKTVKDKDGKEHTVRMPVEPLSCDYRNGFGKAHREEIPRLAASLIGCSYDELVRRQRRYKLVRGGIAVAAVLAAAVFFALYMIMTNIRIEAAYRDAMISRSKNLANQSIELLDDGRRIEALQLALEALPESEDDKKPVTAEAISALNRATLAYKGLRHFSIDEVWNYNANNQINVLKLSDSGTRLACFDRSNSLIVWNTKDHRKCFDINVKSKFVEMDFVNDDMLVVVTSDKVIALNSSSGQTVWTYETEYKDSEIRKGLTKLTDNRIAIIDGASLSLHYLDCSTGKVLKEITVPRTIGDKKNEYLSVLVSDNGERIAFKTLTPDNKTGFGIYNVKTGNILVKNDINNEVHNMYWAGDNRLVIAYFNPSENKSYYSVGAYVLGPAKDRIECFDADSLQSLWTNEFVSMGVAFDVGFMYMAETKRIAYFSGSTCRTYDAETGKLIGEWNTSEPIIDISDRDGDGSPLIITEKGGMATPTSDNYIYMTREFSDDIVDAEVRGGVYCLKRFGSEILHYNSYVYDEEWKAFDENYIFSNINDYFLNDNVLAFVGSVKDKDVSIMLIDPNSNKILGKIEPKSPDSPFNIRLLGEYKGNLYHLDKEEGNIILVETDIKTLKSKEVILSSFYDNERFASFDGSGIAFLSPFDKKVMLLDVNDIDGKPKTFEVDTGRPLIEPVYSEQANLIYVSAKNGEFIIDTLTGKVSQPKLQEDWNGTLNVYMDNDNIVLTTHGSVVILDKDYSVRKNISVSGLIPTGVKIYKPSSAKDAMLLIFCDDGSLFRYSLDGEYIGVNKFTVYTNSVEDAEITIDEKAKLIYIQSYRLTNIIDMDNWLELVYIEESLGHHAPTDHFVTLAYSKTNEIHVGYFRHYTLQELIDRAREYLNGATMSKQMRAVYGLD